MCLFGGRPVMSLRSITGYRLLSLRDISEPAEKKKGALYRWGDDGASWAVLP